MAKILVVEDCPGIWETVADALVDEGHTPLWASRGDEAYAAAVAHAPDVILLDFLLPGMRGDQVAAALRANPTTAGIPVILMTAATDCAERMALVGTPHVLPKPFDLEDIPRCLSRALAAHAA